MPSETLERKTVEADGNWREFLTSILARPCWFIHADVPAARNELGRASDVIVHVDRSYYGMWLVGSRLRGRVNSGQAAACQTRTTKRPQQTQLSACSSNWSRLIEFVHRKPPRVNHSCQFPRTILAEMVQVPFDGCVSTTKGISCSHTNNNPMFRGGIHAQ